MTKNIRSASDRCAIETIDEPRLALGRVQQAADVERLALHPGGEPGRGQQVVQRHRQREPLLGGKKRLEVERRRPCRTAASGSARIRPARSRSRPARQALVEDVRRAGCARGCGAGRRRCRAAPAGPRRAAAIRSRSASASLDQRPAAARRTIAASRAAVRRCCRACRSRCRPRRASRLMRAPSWPHSARPFAPAARPSASANCSAREPLPRRLVGIDPGREVLGAQLGKGEQQVGEVALGIDGDRRDAVDRRLFEQRQAQAGLAAAGHADADGVRRQVLRVVEQRARRLALRAVQVVAPAEVEDAELLEVGGARHSAFTARLDGTDTLRHRENLGADHRRPHGPPRIAERARRDQHRDRQ